MYYQQSKVLVTSADATITGSSVTSSGGTATICATYGTNSDLGPGSSIRAPSNGMAVYDQNSGAFLGTVISATSAHAFTLSRSPGDEKGALLLLSAYGGCGPADYYGGGPGAVSGKPQANYWDNCLWGSRNVTVKDNVFSIDASTVVGLQKREEPLRLHGKCGLQCRRTAPPAVLGFVPGLHREGIRRSRERLVT